MTTDEKLDHVVEGMENIRRLVEKHERDIESVKIAWTVLKWIGGFFLAVIGLIAAVVAMFPSR